MHEPSTVTKWVTVTVCSWRWAGREWETGKLLGNTTDDG